MCHALSVNVFVVIFVYIYRLDGTFGLLPTESKEEASSSYYQETEGFQFVGRHILQVLQEVNVSTLCRKEMELFLKGLSQKKGWALEMFDATAKLPSGLYSGNAHQLGEFDQCVDLMTDDLEGLADPTHDPTMIHGKYCLVLADVSTRGDATPALAHLIHRIRGEHLLISNINDTGHFIPRFSTIHIGVCIPAGCSASELESFLNILTRSLLPNQVERNISVKDQMCYSKSNQKGLPLSAKCVLGFYTIVVIVAFIGTIADSQFLRSFFHKPDRNTVFASLTSFSLGRNFKSLMQNKNEDLPCINGIRALGTLMLYFAHKIIPICMTPYNNRHALIQDSQTPMTAMFRSSMIYTDTFLLLSGVLSSYNFCKEIQKKGHIAWFSRFLIRYIRLTPALFAILLYYAFVMEHMGSGPQWPTVIRPNADLCKKNMLWNLLYVNNFFPFQEMCVTQSHQLAVDMQLFLITPVFIYLLFYNHIVGFLVIFAVNFGSTFLRYFVLLNNKLSLVIHYGVTVEELYKTANLCYSQTFHRATPYLFGVCTGFVLHKYRSQPEKRIPPFIIGVMWAAILAGGAWPIWQLAHLSTPGRFDAQESAFYAAVSPLVWALSMSLLIICCSFGYAEPIQRLLSNGVFAFVSKISYTVFLSQFTVFFHRLASVRTSQFYTKAELIVAEEMFLVLGVSIVITLLFDLPVQNIRAIFVRGKSEENPGTSNGTAKNAEKELKKRN